MPTIAEAGVPGYEATNWYGIAAPVGTPRAVVMILNREISRVLALPEVRARLLNLGMEPETSMPDAYVQYLNREVAKWARVIKSSGISLQ